MKILMYGWEFPPHISGGLGVACYGIVHGLVTNNTKVTLVLPRGKWDSASNDVNPFILNSCTLNAFSAASLVLNDLDIRFVDSLLKPYMSAKSYQQEKQRASFYAGIEFGENYPHLEHHYGDDLIAEVIRYAASAGVIAKSVDHDIIHVHDWLTVLAGVEAKKVSHKPLVFHVHALETDRSGDSLNKAIYKIEKYGLEKADKIIAVSQYTKNCIVKNYHIAANKIAVVHNGLFKSELAGVANDEFLKSNTVLFLGRVTYQKGPFYFIEAAHKILSKRKDIQFVIAGEGDLLYSMIDRVAALRIGQHVHFTGFLERDLVKKIYMLSKVYVMPSVSEPFGISCLEALSHKVPVIISKQSGVAEVLQHAIKVDFWDTNKLAEKIMGLVDYQILGRELLKNSAQELANLSWDNAASAIIKVYKRV